MPEWITNRFMAPVYALLISFGTALVLGAAMTPAVTKTTTEPEKTEPTPALTIELVTKRKGMPDNSPVAELQGSAVHVYRAASDEPLTVGKDGKVTLTPSTGSLTVCVSLPPGWTAPEASQRPVPGSPCWDAEPKNGLVTLLVVKEG
jgi:hypothetical protein